MYLFVMLGRGTILDPYRVEVPLGIWIVLVALQISGILLRGKHIHTISSGTCPSSPVVSAQAGTE